MEKKDIRYYAHISIKFALLALFLIGAYYIGNRYVSIENMQQKSAVLKEMIAERYAYVVLFYMIFFTLCTAFVIPVTIPMTLLGGFLFGTFYGALYATVSGVIGCGVSFIVLRYFFATTIRRRYGNRLKPLNDKIQEYGPTYILILHYSTIFPLFIINSCAALTNIKLPTFMAMSALGLLPVCTIYAFAGRELSTIQSLKDVFSPFVLLALGLLMCLAFIPIIIKWFKKNHHE